MSTPIKVTDIVYFVILETLNVSGMVIEIQRKIFLRVKVLGDIRYDETREVRSVNIYSNYVFKVSEFLNLFCIST